MVGSIVAVTALLDLTINKAFKLTQEISSGWYKASQAMTLLPIRLTELRLQTENYTSLLNKYGMENDSVEQLLRQVSKLLEDEEAKLQQFQRTNCCWRMGRKLLFPDSVITALDGVLAAYKSLSEHIDARETTAQQLEKSSLRRPRELPFSHDDKYVPLEKSVLEVRTALESESSSRIVVICGGPGQGKSSMARYLACLYQDGIQSTTCPAEIVAEQASSSLNLSPKAFENGAFFLRCTKPDTKSLLVQLWQDMRFQTLPTSNDKEPVGDQNALQDEEDILKQLSTRLKYQKVLIVLDDVWDSSTVENLMVQGKWVKYLVTTQVPRFRNDAVEIQISKPNMQEANCIVANYVIGYDPKEISNDIQIEIDGIIRESDWNPLVLANVAVNIRDGAASELSEGKSTRKYLADLQDGDVRRSVSLYGRSYSKRTMGASMEMALKSFSSEEQTLVLLASMFESQPIPEVVFKIFFKSLHSSLAKFSKYSEHLERTNFIEIASVQNFWSTVPRRSWSIHTMRQSVICRIQGKEIALMFGKLCEQVEYNNIVGMLFVLYGQEPWADQATRTLAIPRNYTNCDHFKAGRFPVPPIEPFVWLLHGECHEEWEKHSHQLAIEVLHKYLQSIELYDTSMSELLQKPQAFTPTCEVLYTIHDLSSISTPFKLQQMSLAALETLVHNLALGQRSQLHVHVLSAYPG